MKRRLSIILTLTLALCMGTTAFAANITEINQNTSAPQTGNTQVSFQVDPTYTITIPATVELTRKDIGGTITYESTGSISAAAGLRLKSGDQINVTLTTCAYKLKSNEGAELAYTVKAGTTDIKDASTPVATFITSTQEQNSTLTFVAGNPEYAGSYTDTVTFTVAVVTP